MPLFTYAERVILVNQFKLLTKLDPENQEFYTNATDILSSGYESRYADCCQDVYRNTLSEDECHAVGNSLQMFWDLQRDFDLNNPGKTSKHLDFPGYSGNEETSQMSYAAFLVDKEKKFQSLRLGHDRFNSHYPTADVYARMWPVYQLEITKSSHDSMRLTNEQIERILLERIHPENRK